MNNNNNNNLLIAFSTYLLHMIVNTIIHLIQCHSDIYIYTHKIFIKIIYNIIIYLYPSCLTTILGICFINI